MYAHILYVHINQDVCTVWVIPHVINEEKEHNSWKVFLALIQNKP